MKNILIRLFNSISSKHSNKVKYYLLADKKIWLKFRCDFKIHLKIMSNTICLFWLVEHDNNCYN